MNDIQTNDDEKKRKISLSRLEDVSLDIDVSKLNTGDILLFHGDNNDLWYDKLIEDVTHSPYEHAAIIVRDPWFDDFSGNGVYVIETDGGLDMKGKTSTCTIHEALNGRTWVDVRSWQDVDYNEDVKKNFTKFWKNVKGKPYDYCPCDWMVAGIHNLCCKCCKVCRTTKDFWCSALVAYGCVELGWLPKDTDWSNYAPADLAIMKVQTPYLLGPIWRLL